MILYLLKKSMLQRIQTIYLLLVIVFIILAIFFPFVTFINVGVVTQFNSFGLDPSPEGVSIMLPIYIGLFMIIGVSIATIGLFKNRKRQLLFGKINYILILLTLVLLFIDVDSLSEKLLDVNSLPIYGMGTYFIVCTLPLVFLANRAIKKDEALIKSLDRLR